MPIPDTQVTASTATCDDYQFSSNRTTPGSHNAVGSGKGVVVRGVVVRGVGIRV